MSAKTYRTVPVRNLSSDELLELSKKQKLSLSREDMEVVQQIFREIDRDPTDVELEVIAQTWSEHCKHRIFSASISHSVNGGAPETAEQPCSRPTSRSLPKRSWTQTGLRAQRV